MRARPAGERLMEKFEEDPGTGCWLWTAHCDEGGYARLKVAGRCALAHRVAYELFVAPLATGVELDHVCRNRRCVNPGHLEPVEHRENVARGISPAAFHGRKTHCVRGHDLAQAHIDPKGRRICNACVRARRKQRKVAR